MSNLREGFEKLPEIAEKLRMSEWFYSDHLGCYMVEGGYAGFINGAWFAFQEQQKKIDKISDSFDSFLSECELWGFDSDQADRQLEIIQELLK